MILHVATVRSWGSLQRRGSLDLNAATAAQVTPSNVEPYITELNARVRSVTVWNCIYKLRRAAELLTPGTDYSWLSEIEKDLALVMVPRSKFDRLVFTQRLAKAGLTLVAEAQQFATGPEVYVMARAACTSSNANKELCDLGDRTHVQANSGQLVDRVIQAKYQNEKIR
jgi:hypothetical protein